MGATIRNDVPLLPGLADPHAVFELDTGDLVALSITTTRVPGAIAFACAAWLVDADGDMQAVDGDPVAVQCSHSAPAQQVATLGMQGIADALRDLLLGEPKADPPAIAWGHDYIEQTSIRNAITLARAMGEPIDWSP